MLSKCFDTNTSDICEDTNRQLSKKNRRLNADDSEEINKNYDNGNSVSIPPLESQNSSVNTKNSASASKKKIKRRRSKA